MTCSHQRHVGVDNAAGLPARQANLFRETMSSPNREIVTSSTDSSQQQQDGVEDITPRSYQLELFERAKEKNSILVLGTGSGKTFISILLIKEYADQIRGRLSEGKRTVFVVNTVPLVYQQARAIQRHTALTVGMYEGSMGVDIWKEEQWQEELEKNEVLVMVAKIFLDLVLHKRLPLSQVNLLIVDECHHATGSHPMREIMREFEELKKCNPEECPKVLGLTACVIHKKCKKEKVLPTMKKLEDAMNSALVTSSDIVQVTKYSTAPEEKIVSFEHEQLSDYQEIIITQLMGIVDDVKELPDIDDRCKKIVKKKLNNIKYIMENLGDWCVARAIKYEMEDLDDVDELDTPVVKELMSTLSSRLEQILTVCLEAERKMLNPVHHISKKLRRLLDILQACPEKVYGLIFVDRRNTAKIIYDFLLEAAKRNPELSFIEPLYAVGCNTRPGLDINLAGLEQRKQNQTLEKFRKGECNFIISTSVFEEGVDIRKCNIVIRFDSPCNFRAYVQSRGRARALPSRYVLMVKEREIGSLIDDVSMYREIELVLSQVCHGRQLPSSWDTRLHFAEDQHIPPFQPFGPRGPKITMNSAATLINVYCGHLPQDKFTELTPEIKYIHPNKETVRAGIRLPINAPLKEIVFGELMENKDLAKKSAALCLCIKLFEMGELNKDLRPRDQKKDDLLLDGLVDVPDEQAKKGAPLPGTKKRRQLYKKEVCEAFTHTHEDQYFLYSLGIEPQNARNPDILIDSNICETSVALLCKNELVHCPFFLYFHKWGEVEVRVKPLGKLTNSSPKLLDKIQHFHCLVFQEMLHINPSVLEFGYDSSGVYIAPITKSGSIDEILLQNLEGLTTLRPLVDRNAASGVFHYEKSIYEDSIIYPIYDHKAPLYYVAEVCYDQNPRSQFKQGKKEYDTYEDYYFLRFNLKITNKNQPLLVGKHMVKEFNYLKKQNTTKKKSEKSASDPPRFVPELCCVMRLKASFWWQLTCVPSILHRLNSFGLSQQLSMSLNPAYCQTEGVRRIPIDFDWNDNVVQNLKDNLAVTLMSKKGRHIHPAMLLHALTLRQANDNFDLERLEILGDSFLKYVIAECLFLNFQDKHEGWLSNCRVSLVCNKTLYLLGKMKNIPEKIISQNLHPRWNGHLPGFTIKSDVEEQLKNMNLPQEQWPELPEFGHVHNIKEVVEVKYNEDGKRLGGLCYNPWTEHNVTDKSVADCVEALLGAYLLACGSGAAVTFLHKLGIGVTA
ncbi:hypothetical protein Pcinc_005417, partial [Petrolisthes cinctipes]